MADAIQQKLGIDASAALQTLAQLDQALDGFNKRVLSLSQTLQDFNVHGRESVKIMRSLARTVSSTTSKLSQLNTAPVNLTQGMAAAATAADTANTNLKQTARTLSQVNQESVRLTVSFETMARIVTTQVIVRALSQIRDAFRESVGQAIELQRQVALITTIAGGATQQQITPDIINLSRNLNIPLLEAAQGVYNAISNQVGNYTESLQFSAEAARFAQATNSSLADSVDLLSGALRAFDLDVTQTGRVAGIFFSAIDKGRITPEELANSMGRVLEPASQLGIELEEITAGVAAVSEKGLGASQALTQFRGVITALTKPTVAMQAALEDLGFQNSEQAISTLGLANTLEALIKTTDGTAESIAKLFPNIRGIGGALGLTGENFETFIKDLNAAREAGQEFADTKFLEATSTDAFRLTSALNAAKVTLVSEFGTAVVSAGAKVADFLGGIQGVQRIVKVLVPTLEALAVSVVAIGTAFATTKLIALASLGPVSIALTAILATITAVVGAMTLLEDRSKNLRNAGLKEVRAANNLEFRQAKIEADKILNNKKQNDEAIIQSGLEKLRALNAEEISFNREAIQRDGALRASIDNTLQYIVSRRAEFLRVIEQSIKSIDKEIQESLIRVNALQQSRDKREFDFSTRGLSDKDKAEALLSRSNALATEAQAKFNEALLTGDRVTQKQANALLAEATSAAEQADAVAQRAENRDLEVQAFAQLQSLTDQQISAELQLNEIQDERQRKLEAQRAAQQKILQDLKNQAKIVLDNSGLFNNDGERFSPQQQASRARIRQDALKRIGDLQLQSSDFDLGASLGLADQLQALEREFQANPINLTFSIEGQINTLAAELEQGFAKLIAQFPLAEELGKVLGTTITSVNEAVNGAAKLQQLLNEANAQNSKNQLDQLALRQRREEVLTDLSGRSNRLAGPQSGVAVPFANVLPGGDDIRSANQQSADLTQLRDINDRLLELVQTGTLTAESLEQAKSELRELAQVDVSIFERLTGQQFLGELQELLNILPELNKVLALNESVASQNDLSVPLEQLNLMRDKLGDFGASAEIIPVSLNNATVPAERLENSAKNTATYFERIAVASNSIGAGALAAISNNAFGGVNLQRFARGGFARGTDTILAGLSPGESVINARSTGKFFSQIQAMNAGQTPVFRNQGGDVTTVNVGDIHVHNNSSQQINGRQLVQEVRREARKGFRL